MKGVAIKSCFVFNYPPHKLYSENSKSYLSTERVILFFLVSEFCNKLAGIKEQTAANLMNLVETFRRKTNEIKKR